jgi:SRSO17 transposase
MTGSATTCATGCWSSWLTRPRCWWSIETGDLNKGSHTVGVGRQYPGTAGKVDNAQVAVDLAYAADAGHGVIDRERYLPQGWTDDPARCRAAGVPD